MRKMKNSGIRVLGEIPLNWTVSRLKYYLIEPMKYGASETGVDYDESLCRYIRITDITSDGKLKDKDKLSLTDSQAAGYILRDKTVLFARSGGTVGKSFLYYKSYGRSAFAGYLISAITNEQKMLPEWLMYYTSSSGYWEWVNQIFTQATIQNIGADKYSNMPLAIAPIDEQRKIISFLDLKCSEIDALTADIQSEIDTLEAYKQSIITEAVTKGLDKNGHMKDSGIEWIGDIPKHWEKTPFRAYVRERIERNKDNKSTELLALSFALGVTLYKDKVYNKDRVKENFEEYNIVHKNDLVLSPNDIIKGSIFVSQYDGCISPMYYIFEARNPKSHNLYYLSYLLRTKEAGRRFFYIARGLIGSILDNGKYVTRRMSVSRQELLSFKVLLPPYEEQEKIVKYLDNKCAEINSIISEKQKQLEILADYKKSVIYEYVTGKKEVI